MENNQPGTNKFEQIDIDNRDEKFSNEEFFYILIGLTGGINGGIDYKDEKFFFEGEELSIHDRILSICFLVSYISDIGLLTQILRYLGIFGLVDHVDKGLEKYLSNAASGGFYSKTDVVTVLAVYHSLTSVYNFYIKILKSPKSKPPKPLEINFKNRIIEHNLNEVIRSIHKNNVKQVRIDIAKFPIEEQIIEINKWISMLVDAGYDAESKMFKKDIKYFKEIKKCLLDQKIITPGQLTSYNPEKGFVFSTKTLNSEFEVKKKKSKPKKTLFDFIENVKNKGSFTNDLKDTFKTESGIDFKIMIELLKAEKIFLIASREFAGFYRVIQLYFDRNIGSQNGLNDLYKHTVVEQELYATNIEIIKKKLKPLINKHKIKQA